MIKFLLYFSLCMFFGGEYFIWCVSCKYVYLIIFLKFGVGNQKSRKSWITQFIFFLNFLTRVYSCIILITLCINGSWYFIVMKCVLFLFRAIWHLATKAINDLVSGSYYNSAAKAPNFFFFLFFSLAVRIIFFTAPKMLFMFPFLRDKRALSFPNFSLCFLLSWVSVVCNSAFGRILIYLLQCSLITVVNKNMTWSSNL